MRKIFLVAKNTFRDAIRQKILLLIGFIAIVLVLSSNYFLKLNLGHDQMRFIADFMTGAISFFGSIMAIIVMCQLINSEFENKTAMTLLSKPIGYFSFMGGKFIGAIFLLLVFVFVITICGYGILYYKLIEINRLPQEFLVGRELRLSIFGTFLFALYQWLKLSMICSMACLICSFSRSLMFCVIVSFMAFAVSIMTSSAFAEQNWMNIATSYIFPNLQIFNGIESLIFSESRVLSNSLIGLGGIGIYCTIYIVGIFLISVFSFSKREI